MIQPNRRDPPIISDVTLVAGVGFDLTFNLTTPSVWEIICIFVFFAGLRLVVIFMRWSKYIENTKFCAESNGGGAFIKNHRISLNLIPPLWNLWRREVYCTVPYTLSEKNGARWVPMTKLWVFTNHEIFFLSRHDEIDRGQSRCETLRVEYLIFLAIPWYCLADLVSRDQYQTKA